MYFFGFEKCCQPVADCDYKQFLTILEVKKAKQAIENKIRSGVMNMFSFICFTIRINL